jgi:CRP/FNR family cyclic AMP-dependent transcriptional regulator
MAMRIAGPCSLLGLNAALCQGTHDVSAESLTRVDLRPINRSELIHLIRVSEGIRRCILFALSSELRSYSDGLRRIGLNQTVAGRLSSLLLDLSLELGEAVEGRIRFPLVLSHDELASMIRTTRETVTRTLGEFRKHGWIQSHGEIVTIENADGLASAGIVLPKAC